MNAPSLPTYQQTEAADKKQKRTASNYARLIAGHNFIRQWRKPAQNADFDRTADECMSMRKTWRTKVFLESILFPVVILILVAMMLPHPIDTIRSNGDIIAFTACGWITLLIWNSLRLHPGKKVVQAAGEWSKVWKEAEETGIMDDLRDSIIERIKQDTDFKHGNLDYFMMMRDAADNRLWTLASEVIKFERDGASNRKKAPRKMFDRVYQLSLHKFGTQKVQVGAYFNRPVRAQG